MRPTTAHDRKASFKAYRCTRTVRAATTDGQRHTAVKTDDLDPLVRDAVVSTFLLGPAGAITDASVDEVKVLQPRLATIHARRDDVIALLSDPDSPLSATEVSRQVQELDAKVDAIQARLDQIAAQSARAAMLMDSRTELLGGKTISIPDAVAMKETLAARFDAMPLTQRRALISALLKITINPGRKLADRVVIENVAAPALSTHNDDDGV